jgi:DNA-binding MarR family transcriptional regulator
MDTEQTLYQLILEIRSNFNLLKAYAERMHGDLEITAAMRAVLEALAMEGAQTVPDIARSKGVTRQHIQANVDALACKGLIKLKQNPNHRRSSLVVLSQKGQRIFDRIRQREAAALAKLAKGLSRRDLLAAQAVLQALGNCLHTSLTEER